MYKFTIPLLLIITTLFISFPLGAEATLKARTLSKENTDSIEHLQIYYRGRISPFYTMAKDVTIKLTGKSQFENLNPVMFVTSVISYPSDWLDIPIFQINDKVLADSLNVEKGSRIPVKSLFNSKREYVLSNYIQGLDTPFEKSVIALDEKVSIFISLIENNLYEYPITSSDAKIQGWKIRLEVFYDKAHINSWLWLVAFIFTFIAGISIMQGEILESKVIFAGLSIIATANFVLRWIILSSIPLMNGDDVMIFMTALLFVLAFIFVFKQKWIGLFIAFMGSITAFVAKLSSTDPVITAVPPMLSSPWLAFHVSIIMISYVIFIVLLPASIAMEFTKDKRVIKLSEIVYKINFAGVIFLTIGIILGALWAKEAWGNYWSWDPKENWAAITLILYLFPLCFKKKIINHPHLYGLILLIAFFMLIITYFGVNYFFGGLHSYA